MNSRQKISSLINNTVAKFRQSSNLTSILILVFWAFASRGLGLVRDILVGRLSPIEAEIFHFASLINENIVTLFILGSVGVALLPQIIKLDAPKNTKTNQFLTWSMIFFSGFIGALCLIGIIFSADLLKLLNLDLYTRVKSYGLEYNYILLNQIFLVAPILFAVKTVFGVFLNANKSFKVFALDGVLSNIGSIIGLSLLYGLFGITGAAYGLLAGFTIAMIAFGWDAWRIGFRFDITWFDGIGGYLIQALYLFLPRILIFPAARLAETLTAILTKNTGELSALRMAMNIQGVFYGLMVAVGAVFLPDIAKILINNGKSDVFWKHLYKYLMLTLVFGAIATVITALFNPVLLLIIRTLSFAKPDSLLNHTDLFNLIIQLTVLGSAAIIFQSMCEILNRYFIALEANWYPIISSVIANVVSAILCLVLLQFIVGFTPQVVMFSFVINNVLLTLFLGAKCYADYRQTRQA